MVRSVTVEATVHVTANGAMNITYRFTDVLNLRPENNRKIYFGKQSRARGYNIATSILGLMYHDAMGINEKMKVHATWESSIHF